MYQVAFAGHGVHLLEALNHTEPHATCLWFLPEEAHANISLLRRLPATHVALVQDGRAGHLVSGNTMAGWLYSALGDVEDDNISFRRFDPFSIEELSVLEPKALGVYWPFKSGAPLPKGVNRCPRLYERWSGAWEYAKPHADPRVAEVLADVRVRPTIVAVWILDEDSRTTLPLSPLGSAWMKYIRQTHIPYDLTERRRQLPHAYEELAEEILQWEHIGRKRSEVDPK